MWSTTKWKVKGLSVVSEAEVDVLLESPCFFYDPIDVGNLLSGYSAFSKSSLNIWKFSVHIVLKLSLENFEHYFASMWNECNYAVIWTFFGIALLWDWNENWPFLVLCPLLSFPNSFNCLPKHFNCFTHSQSLPSGSLHKSLILIQQIADRMKTSYRKLIKLIMWITTLSNSMKLWAMLCRAMQDGWDLVESSDKMWSSDEGNGKSLRYSFLENPMNNMQRQKDRTLKDELPRSVGAQYAAGEEGRNNSRKKWRDGAKAKTNTQLWMYLGMKVKSDAVKNDIA